ncbi:MAG: hypothetical protein QXD66_01115 [Candidatus Nezhaarchaeales archaeon]|nr:MAG: hypothetical protein DSO06_04495 [Candidatus Nezhaarchaeota archaeon WYZ-LMO8]
MHVDIVNQLRSRSFEVLGVHERCGEVYIGVKMPELVFTLNSIEAFEVNFPTKLFEKKFKLKLSHLSDLDYEFCRNMKIKPIYMLRRKGLRGFIMQAFNRHKPIYLCRDSVWFPQCAENLFELLEVLKSWYEARHRKG